jgi:hypothetical protein
MITSVTMFAAVLDGDDGLIVTFSDGTNAGYLSEELLKLRPKRAWTTTIPLPQPEREIFPSKLKTDIAQKRGNSVGRLSVN